MKYDRIYEIRRNEHLIDALQRAGKQFIPTDCIINKQLPGIGATYMELEAPRKSIIIEPNVPVIESKAKKHAHCLAVMRGVTVARVVNFLEEHGDAPYKLLTTPESFPKIKEAMQELDLDMYNDCFLLFDECEKLVQDVDFRSSIKLPMDDFFRFHHKALISATPIVASDERFRDFHRILIRPDYDYRLKLNLITTNNIVVALSELIRAKRKSVCIFCNSIDSINSFFRIIPELQNSCTYCSKDGMEKLYLGNRREKSVYISELKHYNFFTSRFFSAVDIECEPPHVVIVSDICGAPQSAIDPKTEAIQIAGRFRKGIASLTHITSIDPELPVQSRAEIEGWLSGASKLYTLWGKQLEQVQNDGKRTLLREAMSHNSYTRFLDERGKEDAFLLANYYEEQAVRHLYTDARLLEEAYRLADYFVVKYEEKQYEVDDKERLAVQRQLSRKSRMQWMLIKWEQIAYLQKSKDKKMQERYYRMVQSMLNSESERNLYLCYQRYGADFVRNTDFKEKTIRESLGVLHSKVLKQSPELHRRFAARFKEGECYTPTEAKVMLKALYKDLNIFCNDRMTAKELEKYAEVSYERKHQDRVIRIVKLKK